MDVVVFGAGSLGSLIGGLLSSANDVTLVGRETHVGAVRERGLAITGLLDLTARPASKTALEAGADIALVTVKAFDTPAAAEALSDFDFDAVLTLQNGLGNEAALAAAIDDPVVSGVTTFGAILREPGVVECTGVGSVTVGPHQASSDYSDAESAAAAFEAAGVDVEVRADMALVLWEKLAVNAGINPVTALAGIDNGALSTGPAGRLARHAATEVATVAREHGIDLSDGAARSSLEAVVETTAQNRSSMRQDVEIGRRTEVDAINGAIVDRAEASVPVNGTLADLVRAWERGRGLR